MGGGGGEKKSPNFNQHLLQTTTANSESVNFIQVCKKIKLKNLLNYTLLITGHQSFCTPVVCKTVVTKVLVDLHYTLTCPVIL